MVCKATRFSNYCPVCCPADQPSVPSGEYITYFEWFAGALQHHNAGPLIDRHGPRLYSQFYLKAGDTGRGSGRLDYSVKSDFLACDDYNCEDLNDADARAVLQDMLARASSLSYISDEGGP